MCGYGDAPRAYLVRLPSGAVTQRNRRFLFPLPRQLSQSTATSLTTQTTPSRSHMRPPPSPPQLAFTTALTGMTTSRPRAVSTAGRPGDTGSTSRPTSPRPTVMSSARPRLSVTLPTGEPAPSPSNVLPTRPVRQARPGPRPANQDAKNVSGAVSKRRVVLTHKAREATPRSYRPAMLYLNRLSPPTDTSTQDSQTDLCLRQSTPWPTTPTTPPGGLSWSLDRPPATSSMTSTPPSPTSNSPPQAPARPPRRCLPPTRTSSSPPRTMTTSPWTPTTQPSPSTDCP